jgi:hypothetical protein
VSGWRGAALGVRARRTRVGGGGRPLERKK